jgi:hypothetical protein
MAETIIRLFRDGDQWCGLSGDDLQDGVAGFGGTPAEALRDLAAIVDLTDWPDNG